MNKITFIASLPESHRQAISLNGDGSATIKLNTSANQVEKIVQLMALTEMPLKITIEPDLSELNN